MTQRATPPGSPGGVVVCVDVGSTFTKAAAVDAAGRLVAASQHPTTAGSDVLDGVDAAIADLGLGRVPDPQVLACSSAGGGLRLAVVGHERVVSAEAGRRVALSAGARVVAVTVGSLDPPGVAKLLGADPDVVLLVGGTDGGDAEVLLGNAAVLGRSPLRVPVVVAGNADAAGEAAALLQGRGRVVIVVDNVIPRIGHLAPGPARRAIREVFIRHVIGGKGLSRGRRFARLVRCATPDAVLAGVEVVAQVAAPGRGAAGAGSGSVAEGAGSGSAAAGAGSGRGAAGVGSGRGAAGVGSGSVAEGAGSGPAAAGRTTSSGDVMAVDVGGATTDVYSVLEPDEHAHDAVVEPLWHGRSVEGDLGMRWGAVDVVLAAAGERIAVPAGLAAAAARRREQVAMLPANADEVAEDLQLASVASIIAVRRHCRPGPEGVRDLSSVGLLIGSGGVLRHAEPRDATRVLEGVLADYAGGWRLPRDAGVLVDRRYLLAPIGLLALAGRGEQARHLAEDLLAGG